MLKHPLRLFAFITFCLLLLQCNKDPLIALRGRVFVAGVEMGNDGTDSAYSIAKLWVDGQAYDLPAATRMAQAEDVFVSKNVLYVVGSEYGSDGSARAVLWRNRQPVYLSAGDVEGQAFGVYVDGGDVYVTGLICKNFVCKTVVWKNGVETLLANDISYPWEIVVADGKQYVTVNKKTDDNLRPALMQGNQLLMLEIPENTFQGEAMAVYVKANHVYSVGSVFHPFLGNIAALWENGTLHVLAKSNQYSKANDVAVTDANDVYVTGAYNQQCVVWKNKQLIRLDNSEYSEGMSIAVSGKNVYVAGVGALPLQGKDHVPLLWKNSIAQELPMNQKSEHGIANAVFVK